MIRPGRTVIRWAYTGASATSLALCVGTTVLGVRGRRRADLCELQRFDGRVPNSGDDAESYVRQLVLCSQAGELELEIDVEVMEWDGDRRWEREWFAGEPTQAARPFRFEWSWAAESPGGRRWCPIVEVPAWAVAGPLAVLPTGWGLGRARRRRQRRRSPHACRRCGYDLRASPGVCPECGAAVPPPATIA